MWGYNSSTLLRMSTARVTACEAIISRIYSASTCWGLALFQGMHGRPREKEILYSLFLHKKTEYLQHMAEPGLEPNLLTLHWACSSLWSCPWETQIGKILCRFMTNITFLSSGKFIGWWYHVCFSSSISICELIEGAVQVRAWDWHQLAVRLQFLWTSISSAVRWG